MFLQSNVCLELFLSRPASSSFQIVIALTQCHTKLHVFDCATVAARFEMPKIEIATNVMYRSVICLTSYSVASLERWFFWLQKSLMKRTSLPNFFANFLRKIPRTPMCVPSGKHVCLWSHVIAAWIVQVSASYDFPVDEAIKNRQTVCRLSSQPCHRASEVEWLVFRINLQEKSRKLGTKEKAFNPDHSARETLHSLLHISFDAAVLVKHAKVIFFLY